jgi:hypothetical protein
MMTLTLFVPRAGPDAMIGIELDESPLTTSGSLIAGAGNGPLDI